MKPPPDPSKPYISFHATVIFILSAIQAISGFGLMVIHGYKSATKTIKHVNESSNHNPDATIPPTTTAPTTPPPATTVISKRLSDAPSLISVSSQQRQKSPELGPPADIHFSHLSRYAEPPLAMITTVFSLRKRYAASAISNILDLLASFFAPFLDKFLPYLLYKDALSPGNLVDVIRIAKKTLFPNGYLAPPQIDPTPEEQVVIRGRLVARIRRVIPEWLSPLILDAHPLAVEQTINDIGSSVLSQMQYPPDHVRFGFGVDGFNPGDGDHDGCEYDGRSSICDGPHPASNCSTGICTTGFVAREFDC